MGLNDTPSSSSVHIAFFGRRNAGKSSLVNKITGQDVSVVSDVKGTTTDPVRKSMELLPLGPVVIIDTPGFDDVGILGEKRISQANKVLREADIAVLVVDSLVGLQEEEKAYISLFNDMKIPYIVVYNKSDLKESLNKDGIHVSSLTGDGIELLKNKLSELKIKEEKSIIKDYIKKRDIVALVTPIDQSAPKGRIILPQQQTLREILDANCKAMVVQHTEYADFLSDLKTKPRLVITDSQEFKYVSDRTPEDVLLTSFSILMANKKGFLESAVKGVSVLKHLVDGDKILISEACTHHRQCEDIGTVKLPLWIGKFTGRDIHFDFSSGNDFPDNIGQYKLVIHCGGCMINDSSMRSRINSVLKAGVSITNYGICIAFMNGILKRSLEIFPDLQKIL